MTAASGLNTSLIEDPKLKRRPPLVSLHDTRLDAATSYPSFAVIQSLVALLTKPGMTSLSASNSFAENIKRLGSTSPGTDVTDPALSRPAPLQLADALSACVLSNRLASPLRQWASKHLLETLSSLRCVGDAMNENMADLTGDLPTCGTSRLEAHQNRVTGCVYSEKSSMLASRYSYLLLSVTVGRSLFPNHHNCNMRLCPVRMN